MNPSRSSFDAPPPHSNNYIFQDFNQAHPSTPKASGSTYIRHFDDVLVSAKGLHPAHQFLGSYAGQNPQANTLDQSNVSNISIDPHRSSPQAHPTFVRAQLSTSRYDDNILRGSTNHYENHGLVTYGLEAQGNTYTNHQRTCSPIFNNHQRTLSALSRNSRATPMPNLQSSPAEQPDISSNHFTPYRGLFNDSTEARNHRHHVTRFGRQPYVAPANDPSIDEIEKDRQYQVGRIYGAMVRGDRAQDNPGSIAVKRWVHPGAHYKSDLIEAFAHKVFDSLMAQVKEGFRGWHHNDYVEDDRKGEKDDRDVDCLGRLDNIIDALEREKTICEDVMNSASQIRMFVNAPIAYAMRKYQNRVGNSKRGRTKDTNESRSRQTKVRRAGGRRARARSGTVSEIPASRDTTPQFQIANSPATPYFLAPASQHAPRLTSANQSCQPPYRAAAAASLLPTGYPHVNAVSPSVMPNSTTKPPMMSRSVVSPPFRPSSQYCSQNYTAMPPTQALPHISSSPLSYAQQSTSPSSDDVRNQGFLAPLNAWSNPQGFSEPVCATVEPILPSGDFLFTETPWLNNIDLMQTDNSLNHHHHDSTAGGVSLADLEHQISQPAEHGTDECPNFETLWNNQPGVQQFSFQPRDSDQNQS